MIFLFLFPLTLIAFFEDYAISQMIKNEKWKDVQGFFENKVKDNPLDASSLYSAGVAAFKQEDLERAHALFSRACEFKSDIEEKALFNIGNIEMIHKKYQEALDAYQEVLKINPDNQRARERAELARQMLQQPPQNDKSENHKNENKDDKNQDSSDQQSSEDQSKDKDQSPEQDQQKNNNNSAGEDTEDKSQNSDQDGKQQKNQEKGQNDRREDNKKSDHKQKQDSGQDEHEKAESQATEHEKKQDIEGQDEKNDHNKSNKGSKDQSSRIDPKDQWKTRLFNALDKVEENSHKDMMQVVYAAQAPQDQTPNW